ncbi:MAG: response regulator transcription factor [Actinomycetota bacterium]|nr:response regulator transcription factor [Actinomycetota bacterium]
MITRCSARDWPSCSGSDTTFHVVAQGSDGVDALALVAEHRPDVVLVDVEMPGPGARATVSRLRQEHPDTQVIVLTMHDKPELVRELLDEGTAAYLVKTIAREEHHGGALGGD